MSFRLYETGFLLFQLQSTAPSNIPDEENAARDNFSGPRGTVHPPVFAIRNQADVFEHKDNQLPKYEDLFPSTQININTEMK
jgi:hypothetical protein